MSLNKSSGNMYPWITHTWCPVKGKCPYQCTYCYVQSISKKYGKEQRPLHLDEKEVRTDLGKHNYIFICSGCDLFHPDAPRDWITDVRNHTLQYPDNQYLWHTKNPQRLVELIEPGPTDVACVTIESNINYTKISAAPDPFDRAMHLQKWEGRKMITIEPIMEFTLAGFIDLILSCKPDQVNIGADSGQNGLPEPSAWKIERLVDVLERHNITVVLKKNLNRLVA